MSYYFQGCTRLSANRSVWLSNVIPEKNISSPTTFPSNQSVYCLWRVFVATGYRIKLHFNSFDLVNSTNCSKAAVKVVEKRGVISIPLGKYCGGHVPDDIVSSLSFVTVVYTATNGSALMHPGFQASLSLVPAGEKF